MGRLIISQVQELMQKQSKVEVDRRKKRAEFGINDNKFVITAVGRLEKKIRMLKI